MCVLASAVDIFSSHPSRGGDQQQLVTASLRFIPVLGTMKTFIFA